MKTRIFSFMLVLMVALSVFMPCSVFAKIDDSTQGAEKVVFKDSALNAEAIGKALTKDKGTTYENGKVEYDGTTFSIISKGEKLELLTIGDGVIYMIPANFEEGKAKDVNKAMKLFVDALETAGVSADSAQTLMNDIQDVDTTVATVMLPLIFESTEADIYTAYTWMKPFLDILNVVLGIGCVLLILLLLGSTVIDLAFIGLPIAREYAMGKGEQSGSGKPPLVSYEAQSTIKEIEGGIGNGEYKNAYLVYFKRRSLTYIVLALCIMYLITGGISGIISFILSLTRGITG